MDFQKSIDKHIQECEMRDLINGRFVSIKPKVWNIDVSNFTPVEASRWIDRIIDHYDNKK